MAFSNQHDGLNRRVAKTLGSTQAWRALYQDGRIAAYVDNTAGTILKEFVYGTGRNVADYMTAGGTQYRIISDHLGSPRLVVDASSGAVIERIDYDVFGKILRDTNSCFQPFGFAGGIYDPDTKLVRFGARDYDPETGRWTTKDSILFWGGDTNLYGYVMNDPVNLVDPSGKNPFVFVPAIVIGGWLGGYYIWDNYIRPRTPLEDLQNQYNNQIMWKKNGGQCPVSDSPGGRPGYNSSPPSGGSQRAASPYDA